MLTDRLWPMITKLARSSRRCSVAVAYLGTGASKILPLKAGDNLVVDFSEATVRGGQTNPSEVETFLRRNVNVYNCPNLHAKVFVFDDKLIVGSPNISRHSRNRLIEAGLFCSNRHISSQVKGWMKDELQREPITPKLVGIRKKIYSPPHFLSGGIRKKTKVGPQHSPMWLLSTQNLDYEEDETRVTTKDVEKLTRRLRHPDKYKVEPVRLPASSKVARSARIGDLIVQIWSGMGTTKVYPPSRLVSKRTHDRTSRVFVYLEESRHPKKRTWKQFRAVVKSLAGGRRITKRSERLLPSNELRHAILGLWS